MKNHILAKIFSLLVIILFSLLVFRQSLYVEAFDRESSHTSERTTSGDIRSLYPRDNSSVNTSLPLPTYTLPVIPKITWTPPVLTLPTIILTRPSIKPILSPSPTIPASSPTPTQLYPQEVYQKYCEDNNGGWSQMYKECSFSYNAEQKAVMQCQLYGGTFDFCASPCRHNQDENMACITVCMMLCKF